MFNMGKLYMTFGINNVIADNVQFSEEILKCVSRYKNHDWGEMCEDDKQLNDDVV